MKGLRAVRNLIILNSLLFKKITIKKMKELKTNRLNYS